ncbi:MAG TPA: hypothetical protein PK293_17975 [Spirochaetota bacterium]|nr:hypothetical protein [Spirochaetota bacterium]HPF07937.1 hypothetical protein [Spirochaetota bacterium]HPJ44267.1 hypothetical protein [Spirochaetota bacterium]HPR39347.1 hypothetical protein [Spirochaetota bacterium]
MSKEKVLITVKTYPTYSKSYEELVCTAGFKEDGSFIRIYPMPYRKLEYEQQFEKYRWIELELVRNTKDFRPESYRPVNYEKITQLDFVDSEKGTWNRRKEICLKKVYNDMSVLIKEAHDPAKWVSLAVFKPAFIDDVIIKETEREWKKAEEIAINKEQMDLFPEHKKLEIVKKVPYNFYYRFRDINEKKSELMISDWEAAKLYWNCLKKHDNDEKKACDDVRKKYMDEFSKKDIYLFLGTTKEHHVKSRNPFIVIGVFYPKIDLQGKLF